MGPPDATGQYVVASGGPLAALVHCCKFACVPDGCYQFRVNDVNGMSTGGYVVRTQGTNIRIIDNANNFSTGPVSTSGEAFCLPLGTTELLYSAAISTSGQMVNTSFATKTLLLLLITMVVALLVRTLDTISGLRSERFI
ncbi:MAG: hypothetical protein IPI91_03925 [Flavobacteriales bacterium]|nr:hypothetical protein [Flavobacteriales bacterium]